MRALVAVLAIALLTACAPGDEEPNLLLSCSVALPRQWRDALAAHAVKENAQIVAASEDGRTTIHLTSPPENELTLVGDDGQRRSIVKTKDYIRPEVEFIGHTVKYAIDAPYLKPVLYLWDAQTGGPPLPTGEQWPLKVLDRWTDGTTSAWPPVPEAGRLYVRRTGWPGPRMIAEIRVEEPHTFVLNPSVHGDFVSWSWGPRTSPTSVPARPSPCAVATTNSTC